MSSTQLYFAIGVPFITLLIVFLPNQAGMKSLGSRIGDLGSRIDEQSKLLGSRIDEINKSLCSRIDNQGGVLGSRIDALATGFREFYATQRQHETRL